MVALTLTSSHARPLKPLVEAALKNEQRLLQAGIQRTEQRLREFETEHGMSSTEFLRCYENDELQETLDFVEWIGEHRLLERMREKVNILQEIHFED
jgi:phage shock protein A